MVVIACVALFIFFCLGCNIAITITITILLRYHRMIWKDNCSFCSVCHQMLLLGLPVFAQAKAFLEVEPPNAREASFLAVCAMHDRAGWQTWAFNGSFEVVPVARIVCKRGHVINAQLPKRISQFKPSCTGGQCRRDAAAADVKATLPLVPGI